MEKPPPKGRKLGLLVLSGLVALTFVVTGGSKLADVPPSPENFTRWGFSMTFMHAIGAIEVFGGVALVPPRVSPFAALGLIGVMLGALKTGIQFGELLHIALPAVLLVFLGILVYARRDALNLGRGRGAGPT